MTIHKVGNKGGKVLRSGLSNGKEIITTPNIGIIQPSQSSRIKNALGRNVSIGGTVDWTTFVAQDPYYSNVVLYLPCDGTNDSTDIWDYSSNALVPPTRVGNPRLKTAIKKYGTSSLYLDGNSYLTLPNTNKWQFGTGDFTLECWAYGVSAASSTNTNYSLFFGATDNVGASTARWLGGIIPLTQNGFNAGIFFNSSTGVGTWNVFSGNSGLVSPTPSTNEWKHLAWVRSGNNMLFFYNGVLMNTVAFLNNTMPNPVNALAIGASATGLFITTGYFDSIRITKGIARYTANFNPETDTYLAY